MVLIHKKVSRLQLRTLTAVWTEKVSLENMSSWTEKTVGLQSRWAEEQSDVCASGELFILGAYLSSSIQSLTQALSMGSFDCQGQGTARY